LPRNRFNLPEAPNLFPAAKDICVEVRGFESGLLGAITYLAWDGSKSAVVIDAGLGTADSAGKFSEENGLRPSLLINTHGHFDHIADNDRFRGLFGARFGLKIAASKKDGELFADPVGALGFPIPLQIKPSKIEIDLDSQTKIKIGKMLFSILKTPGHTKGSVCICEKSANALFSGDTLFSGSCGRTDLKGGSAGEMRESLRDLAKLPAQTKVYPGHGEATTIGKELGWMEGF